MSPIDNIRYHESEPFLSRTAEAPELRQALREHFWGFPDAGKELCGGVKVLPFRGFTVIVRRVKTRHWLSVLYIFQLPQEQKRFDAMLKEVRELYCSKP